MTHDNLTEHDEILIGKYLDNACSFFERKRAERLIENNRSAKEYFSQLKALGKVYKEVLASETENFDLWSTIERRISQEERSEVLLGKRIIVQTQRASFWETLESLVNVRYAGALVAASVLGFLFIQMPMSKSSLNGSVASNSVGNSNVALVRSEPQIIDDQVQSTMEVDWMRSRGRVRVMQGSRGNSIIWVHKKKDTVDARPLSSPGRVEIIDRADLSSSDR